MGKSLFEKLWSRHVVAELGDGYALLHVDRHVVNDTVSAGFAALEKRGLPLFSPTLTSVVPDHMVPTVKLPGAPVPVMVTMAREGARKSGARLFDVEDEAFGIVHQMTPEQGLALPGLTFACGDSHSSTIGALGALAWGVGQSEVNHILATQTSIQARPRSMRVNLEGALGPGVHAKDLILHLIARLGADSGVGYAVEYAGAAIRAMGMDGRFTLCNMATDMGARFGLIAPDETTFAYLHGRRFSPTGALWEQALAHWRALPSDADAAFDHEVTVDVTALAPQISWGTSLNHVTPVDRPLPDPADEPDPDKRAAMRSALAYMGLQPGARMDGLPVDWVFIGSCTNARIGDLQAAARLVAGRKVAPGVRAWVVPGSNQARRDAESQGLDRIFLEAGFEWRLPSCSMCAAANGDLVGPGERAISTTNRNYEGRQGPGARTHLASPAMAAAAAVAGCIVDPRRFTGA